MPHRAAWPEWVCELPVDPDSGGRRLVHAADDGDEIIGKPVTPQNLPHVVMADIVERACDVQGHQARPNSRSALLVAEVHDGDAVLDVCQGVVHGPLWS